MAPASKRVAPPKTRTSVAKRAAGAAKAPAVAPDAPPIDADEAEAPAPPFVRVRHSAALHEKTLRVLCALEEADDATAHREALSALVIELTDNGFDYCFMKPLKRARVGFIAEQTAGLGMAGMRQMMATVVRQIIGRMDGPQLLSVCGSIRVLMR